MISLSILDHYLERTIKVGFNGVFELLGNLFPVSVLFGGIPIFLLQPMFWRLILKRVGIDLADDVDQKEMAIDSEESHNHLIRSQL
jgi:hypothetical protein